VGCCPGEGGGDGRQRTQLRNGTSRTINSGNARPAGVCLITLDKGRRRGL
jgi:hypothetical protein